MNDKLIQSYGKNLVRRMLYNILFGGITIICLGCLAFGIASIPEDIISRDAKPFLLVGLLVIFLAVTIGGTIYWVLSRNRQLYNQLDKAFTPLGMVGSRYLTNGRQYQGPVRGRKVNAYYHISGGRTFRTPDLTIYVEGDFRTRLGIGSKNVLTTAGSTLTGQTHLELNEPAYDELLVYPLDENWSRNLLTAPQTREIVVRLVGKEAPGTRGLIFAPQSLKLQIRHFDPNIITPNAVREWIDDLLELTEIGEGLLPPTQTAQASDLELASQSNRAKFTLIALGIVALMIICPLLIVGGVFLALFLLGIIP